MSFSRVLYDRHGELLSARLSDDGQWRFPLEDEVPEKFFNALLTFEDKRFYDHHGVDGLALLRALRSNWRAGKIVSGGSTLTMQLARIVDGHQARTVTQKMRELLLAWRLEWRFEKHELLRLYAQLAPFGGNIVGVETAAWRYFGRAARHLSWAEAATLAVLPNSPALIHPGRARAHLQRKRDALLQQLAARDVLTALDLKAALSEPLPTQVLPLPKRAEQLLDRYASSAIATHTFIDAATQDFTREAVRRYNAQLQQFGINDAAALIIRNDDLSVLAYVGNAADSDSTAAAKFVDLARRPRSSGSIFKPFLYAAMLQQGQITPEMLVADVPTQINGYIPENFDHTYRGAVSAKQALALSLNIPAVRLLREFGIERFYLVLNNSGASTLFRRPDDYGLTLILGGAETTLWDVAQMYANLARHAQQPNRVSNTFASIRLQHAQPSQTWVQNDIGSGAAYLTVQALQEVNRPGDESFWRNFSSSKKIAWKTGTSFGLRDAWAVGVTPEYTVAVWVGNANGVGVAGLSGTQSAAPLLFQLFNYLPDTTWFDAPISELTDIDVCRDDGYLPNQGCATQTVSVPKHSHFEKVSPYHRFIHTDALRQWQVNNQCDDRPLRSESWFVLPPAWEYFYRRHHPDYRPLPKWKNGCNAPNDDQPIGLLYPQEGSRVFIPADLDGATSRVIFEAVHREQNATLFWHIDDQFIGKTRHFHQQMVNPEGGDHWLVIQDDQGHRLSRKFTVMAK